MPKQGILCALNNWGEINCTNFWGKKCTNIFFLNFRKSPKTVQYFGFFITLLKTTQGHLMYCSSNCIDLLTSSRHRNGLTCINSMLAYGHHCRHGTENGTDKVKTCRGMKTFSLQHMLLWYGFYRCASFEYAWKNASPRCVSYDQLRAEHDVHVTCANMSLTKLILTSLVSSRQVTSTV